MIAPTRSKLWSAVFVFLGFFMETFSPNLYYPLVSIIVLFALLRGYVLVNVYSAGCMPMEHNALFA